ncbi:MAG: DEAD/DEAH box helicase [Chloroflexota bacterium]
MPGAAAPAQPSAAFHPAVADWLAAAFAAPTRAQQLGWPPIIQGESTLILAPTGSGKTLAAFLTAIDRLMFTPVPPDARRCRVIYVSPLRALAFDVEKNLRAPIAGIARAAEIRGEPFHVPTVALRTGDTLASDRARMQRHPPDILITTPESLFLLLTSRARAMLASARLVILDEIHTLVGSKRGAHLAVSLERLQELTGDPLQRIGLSATQRPLDEVARYLGGYTGAAEASAPRPVTIVDASARKAFDIKVEVPVEDMRDLGSVLADTGQIPEGPAAAVKRRSIWPAIYPRLLDLIAAHRSTIIFVNSRRLAERTAGALNELSVERGGAELARAHHGSISREQRVEIEDSLKSGRLPAMVATSSLELGIDMGAVDLVIQIETPPSVASGIQRIGRAGHQVESESRGIIFPKFRGDLLAAATITRSMMAGAVESTRIPANPLDVLAQQLVASCVDDERAVGGLYALVRRAAPFARLPQSQFEGVLDMLSGRYPSDELAELRPRLTWDRLKGTVRARDGARQLVVANAGTIPDRGLYGVFIDDVDAGDGSGAVAGGTTRSRTSRRVGELDEEMVFETSPGDIIILGASSWRVTEITRDRVLVIPAPGEPGRMPFWRGDRMSRPVELGGAIGTLARELSSLPRDTGIERLTEEHGLNQLAAENLLTYLDDQRLAVGAVPDDRTIVVERTRDEMGDWRICLLSPWGGRVHAPWALVMQALIRRATGSDDNLDLMWTDDGVVVRFADRDIPPDASLLLPDPDEIETLIMRELGSSALYAGFFREAAGRALLLPRRRPGLRSPLWMQRKRAADLLGVTGRFGTFPIVLEAFRECLQDAFDLPAFVELARKIRGREIRVVTVDSETPSPFASSLMFSWVGNFLYDYDQPLAERRAMALTVDHAQLRELLGEPDLRELLDPRAIDELERSWLGLASGHPIETPDRLHDLLLRIGDLTREEIAAYGEPGVVDSLVQARRAIEVTVAGEQRYAAAEDAGRLRDALGVPPPRGLPGAFLEPVPDALEQLLGRYARARGPFTGKEAAQRFGLGVAPVDAALRTLRDRGRLVEGELRPGGHGPEWCDASNLATLRRRSLAHARKQVAPVNAATFASFTLAWHGITTAGPHGDPSLGPDRLLDVIESLQGTFLPASVLERDVLPARLPGYSPRHLDVLCAAGEVLWLGADTLGERDGRVALYLTDSFPSLRPDVADPPSAALHTRILDHLRTRGASYFADIHTALGGLQPALVDALWDLVWAGAVTNDGFGALRAYLGDGGGGMARRRAAGFRSRRQAPPTAAGRWSLVGAREEPAPNGAARARAICEQLTTRHGVVTRPVIASEAIPGGFATLYPVLKAMEEAGRVRRGYFVEGLGGAQFAHPAAVDRLRAVEAAEIRARHVVLAATDPANPYGAALAWPTASSARLARSAGAYVVLSNGMLTGYLPRGERDLATLLPAAEPDQSDAVQDLVDALAQWTTSTGRFSTGWQSIDGVPLARSALLPHFQRRGFTLVGSTLRPPRD